MKEELRVRLASRLIGDSDSEPDCAVLVLSLKDVIIVVACFLDGNREGEGLVRVGEDLLGACMLSLSPA